MKTKRSRALLRAVGATSALSLALVAGIAWMGSADGAMADPARPGADPAPPLDAADHSASTAPGPDAARRPDEGIKVHGHWTIEVMDPDGSIVQRREFENSLSGSGRLEEVLGRLVAVGGWTIQLFAQSPNQVCEQPAGVPNPLCLIAEPTSTSTDNNVFKNLTPSVSTGSLTLAGSLIAQRDGTFSIVSTLLGSCPSSVPPDSCPGAEVSGWVFTSTILSPFITVSNGQLVEVSVVITFS